MSCIENSGVVDFLNHYPHWSRFSSLAATFELCRLFVRNPWPTLLLVISLKTSLAPQAGKKCAHYSVVGSLWRVGNTCVVSVTQHPMTHQGACQRSQPTHNAAGGLAAILLFPSAPFPATATASGLPALFVFSALGFLQAVPAGLYSFTVPFSFS